MSEVILQGISADELAAKIAGRITPPPPVGVDVLEVKLTREQIMSALLWSKDKFYRVKAEKNIEAVDKRGNAPLYTLSQFIQVPVGL